MRCKCKARFTSNMDKYNVEMHVTREIPAANLEIKYDYPKKRYLYTSVRTSQVTTIPLR